MRDRESILQEVARGSEETRHRCTIELLIDIRELLQTTVILDMSGQDLPQTYMRELFQILSTTPDGSSPGPEGPYPANP